MPMKTGTTIVKLRALRRAVLEDGKVDWEETSRLLDFVRPLAAKDDYLFQDFERLLKKCRADGMITREESCLMATQLEALVNYLMSQRLRFWLVVVIVLLLAVVSLVLGARLCETVENSTSVGYFCYNTQTFSHQKEKSNGILD